MICLIPLQEMHRRDDGRRILAFGSGVVGDRAAVPSNQPGARRVDDRRVISGIVHVLKAGCRWKDCPAAYGPPTTVYNRFNRWSRRGLWGDLRRPGRSGGSRPRTSASTRPPSGRIARRMVEKGGEGSGHRALARRSHHENPRPDRWLRARRRASAHTRELRRHLRRTEPSGRPIGAETADRRQGIRRQQSAELPKGTANRGGHPLHDRAQAADPLRPPGLPPAQPDRRAFFSLKDFRRIATRYDKLTRNFLAAVEIAAVILWWT